MSELGAIVHRAKLAHQAGAGFHLTDEEMTKVLDAAASVAVTSNAAVKVSSFVDECLTPRPNWKTQSFRYYAAHFLVGAGLVYGNLDAHVRALAGVLQKQYDIGVEHGATCPPEYTPQNVASSADG